jgi:hypothetical protein
MPIGSHPATIFISYPGSGLNVVPPNTGWTVLTVVGRAIGIAGTEPRAVTEVLVQLGHSDVDHAKFGPWVAATLKPSAHQGPGGAPAVDFSVTFETPLLGYNYVVSAKSTLEQTSAKPHSGAETTLNFFFVISANPIKWTSVFLTIQPIVVSLSTGDTCTLAVDSVTPAGSFDSITGAISIDLTLDFNTSNKFVQSWKGEYRLTTTPGNTLTNTGQLVLASPAHETMFTDIQEIGDVIGLPKTKSSLSVTASLAAIPPAPPGSSSFDTTFNGMATIVTDNAQILTRTGEISGKLLFL